MRGVYVYYVGRFAVHIEEHDEKGLRRLCRRMRREFYLLTRKRDAGEVKGAVPDAVIRSQDTDWGHGNGNLSPHKKG